MDGPSNGYQAVVSVDVKKTPFHVDRQPFVQKLRILYGPNLTNPLLMASQTRGEECVSRSRHCMVVFFATQTWCC